MDVILKNIVKDLGIGLELIIDIYKKTNAVIFINLTIDHLNTIHDDIEDVEFRAHIKGMIDDLIKLKSK